MTGWSTNHLLRNLNRQRSQRSAQELVYKITVHDADLVMKGVHGVMKRLDLIIFVLEEHHKVQGLWVQLEFLGTVRTICLATLDETSSTYLKLATLGGEQGSFFKANHTTLIKRDHRGFNTNCSLLGSVSLTEGFTFKSTLSNLSCLSVFNLELAHGVGGFQYKSFFQNFFHIKFFLSSTILWSLSNWV